jgi:hypothetical protein
MNAFTRISAAAMLCAATSIASAASEGDNYFGLGYGMVTYSEDGLGDVNPTALVGRLGTYVTNNVSIEGRYGFGLIDDSLVISGVTVDVEIDSIMGVYGVVHNDISADASIYGLLGFTKGEITANLSRPGFQPVSANDSDTGLSFGAGLDTGKFNIEFTQYLSESTYDVTALSLGFTF